MILGDQRIHPWYFHNDCKGNESHSVTVGKCKKMNSIIDL